MNSATQYTLFISNGHGEDVCGAAIASCLRRIAPHRQIQAFPFIDKGEAYLKQEIPVIGPHYNLPYGGHIYGRPIPILVDTLYGLPLLLQQIHFLKQIAPQVSEVVAVGDIVPLMLNRYFIKKPLRVSCRDG